MGIGTRSMSRRAFLRSIICTAGGVAAATLLNGCKPSGGAEGQPTAAVPTKVGAPQEAGTGGITLRFWSHNNPAFVKANEAAIQKWLEQKPGVQIKYENFPYDEFIQTIQTSMAAKNEADIIEMFGSWVQSYAKGGTLSVAPEDIMSLAEARQLFYAAPLDGYVWEGKLYGLPNEYNLENGGVLVNKRMFEEAALPYPPEWKSWDELVSDAKKLTKFDGQTMTVAGFHYVTGDGLGFLFWEGILERGGDYFADDKVHLNLVSPQAEATTEWLVGMAQKDRVVDPMTFNPESNWVGDSFFQGLVAIGYIGPWIVPVARENHPDFADPWNYVSCPYYGEKMSFAADSGWGKVVSPNSKGIREAWEFAKFATADNANARAWNVGTGTVPALKAVAEDPTLLNDLDWLGPSLKVLPYGRYVGMLQDRDFVWYNVVATHLVEALQGQLTVKEALNKMHEEANAMIDSKISQ